MLYAGVLSSGYRTPMYCTAWTQSLLGLACQPFGKFCMTTLQPHLHSPLSIVTYLAGSPRWLAVYRLSFPLLTRVYQTHARGRRCLPFTRKAGVVVIPFYGIISLHGYAVTKIKTTFAAQPPPLPVVSSEQVAHTACTRLALRAPATGCVLSRRFGSAVGSTQTRASG